jgi:hypothetical protein
MILANSSHGKENPSLGIWSLPLDTRLSLPDQFHNFTTYVPLRCVLQTSINLCINIPKWSLLLKSFEQNFACISCFLPLQNVIFPVHSTFLDQICPLVLQRCKTRYQVPREEQVSMFQNRVQRGISGAKEHEVTGESRRYAVNCFVVSEKWSL